MNMVEVKENTKKKYLIKKFSNTILKKNLKRNKYFLNSIRFLYLKFFVNQNARRS